jgi:hypothetical protein
VTTNLVAVIGVPLHTVSLSTRTITSTSGVSSTWGRVSPSEWLATTGAGTDETPDMVDRLGTAMPARRVVVAVSSRSVWNTSQSSEAGISGRRHVS